MRDLRIACLTMVRDEPFFLPIWCRYYGDLFGAENLFVIDHNSTEPAKSYVPDTRINTIRIPHDQALDVSHRFALVTNTVHMLKLYYDVVIYNDVDEIFLPDPAVYPDLTAYLAHRMGHIPKGCSGVAGMGVELLHDHTNEPAFDVTQPVLQQRSLFNYEPWYAKPHILLDPCEVGAHGIDKPWMLDRDLLVCHLRFVDREELIRRQRVRNAAYQKGLAANQSPQDPQPQSHWAKPADQAYGDLDWRLSLPHNPAEFPHKDWLARYFGGDRGPLIGAQWGVKRTGRSHKTENWLVDFLPKERGYTEFTSHHYKLPDRFRRST